MEAKKARKARLLKALAAFDAFLAKVMEGPTDHSTDGRCAEHQALETGADLSSEEVPF